MINTELCEICLGDGGWLRVADWLPEGEILTFVRCKGEKREIDNNNIEIGGHAFRSIFDDEENCFYDLRGNKIDIPARRAKLKLKQDGKIKVDFYFKDKIEIEGYIFKAALSISKLSENDFKIAEEIGSELSKIKNKIDKIFCGE